MDKGLPRTDDTGTGRCRQARSQKRDFQSKPRQVCTRKLSRRNSRATGKSKARAGRRPQHSAPSSPSRLQIYRLGNSSLLQTFEFRVERMRALGLHHRGQFYLCGHAVVSLTPRWDSIEKKLYVGTKLIKHFKQNAENQIAILDAFQLNNWCKRIDDPVPYSGCSAPARRLNLTIRDLNRAHECPGVLCFRGDGTGQGVMWELTK